MSVSFNTDNINHEINDMRDVARFMLAKKIQFTRISEQMSVFAQADDSPEELKA